MICFFVLVAKFNTKKLNVFSQFTLVKIWKICFLFWD